VARHITVVANNVGLKQTAVPSIVSKIATSEALLLLFFFK
jgi:hypothetical protein